MTLPERFTKKLDKSGDCWLWTRYVNPNGYGHYRHDKKLFLAHRFCWEHFNGKIPENFYVCHKCDVPSCVNPDHLFIGTQKDNMQDMCIKGRSVKNKIREGKKLNLEQVNEIRRLRTEEFLTYVMIAKKFNVDNTTIGLIIRNKIWKVELYA